MFEQPGITNPDHISGRAGQYLHSPGWSARLEFEFGRSFTLVAASAKDVMGLVEPRENGIAVLDNDTGHVVLDGHMRQNSGMAGPGEIQQFEFDRIRGMDWAAFSEFCRTHSRFRGPKASPDIAAGLAPDAGNPIMQAIHTGKPVPQEGRDIRTAAMREANAAGGHHPSFPARTRTEMEAALATHPARDEDGLYRLSWCIKVGTVGSGRLNVSGHHEGFDPDPTMDERWDAYLDENPDLFEELARDALSRFVGGGFEPWPGNSGETAGFQVTGRSGGWLIMTDATGFGPGHIGFESQQEFIAALSEMTDDEVSSLYRVVASLDHELADPNVEMAHHFAAHRESMEQGWACESSPSL